MVGCRNLFENKKYKKKLKKYVKSKYF